MTIRSPRGRLACAAALAVLAGAFAFGQHQYGLKNTLSPSYWMRRTFGVGAYDPNLQVLKGGNPAQREVALTFDDGPRPGTCEALLDILKERGIRATFFVVGDHVRQYPHLVRRMLAEGHEVGNHSQTHHYRFDTLPPDQLRREINDVDINFCRVTGRHMRLLRPPGVRYNGEVAQVSKDLGYQMVSWNVGAKDFRPVSADQVASRVLRHLHDGGIILLHDRYPGTVEALPRILDEATRRGYRFVTISEMLARLPNPVRVEANPRAEWELDLAGGP